MKIEKMCSKQDIVQTLKKTATYSKMEHLKKLAEYIQAEIELDNLKDFIHLEYYELRYKKEGYQIVKITSNYDSEKNMWVADKEETVQEIRIADIENI